MNTDLTFPIVVIGAGSGGLTAAKTAARFGIKVALLEAEKIGGDCLHTGCVPSKSLISIARKYNDANSLSAFGAEDKTHLDYTAIKQYIEQRQQKIIDFSDNAEALENEGVTFIKGTYSFSDAHTLIDTNGKKLKFKKCIVATGSSPVVPPIDGLDTVSYMTSDSIWDLDALPDSLAIIGGGPIGLELGQALAMLGSQVHIFERGDRLVPRFDKEIVESLAKGLDKSGVTIHYESSPSSISNSHDESIEISYDNKNDKKQLTVTHLLVATGRQPSTEQLSLKSAGIKVTEKKGIIINDNLQTSQSHIYAVGDCVGGPQFTHWAAEQGAIAAIHAMFGTGKAPDANKLPSATFTTPEIAQIGKSENDLKGFGTDYEKHIIPYAEIDKAIAEDEEGFITVLTDRNNKVLGANVVGHNAAELIAHFVQLMANDRSFQSWSTGIQPYPTYSLSIKQTAAYSKLDHYKGNVFLRLLLKVRGMK